MASPAKIAGKRILLYGDPKIGTTHVAFALAESSVVLSIHDGWTRAAENGQRGKTLDSWEDFRAITTKLSDPKARGNAALIVDDLSAAYQACRDHVLHHAGYRHESDGERGLGWGLVQSEWRMWHRTMLKGGGYIMTSHASPSEIVTPTRTYHRWGPSVAPRALEDVMPHLDCIAILRYQSGESAQQERIVQLGGSEDAVAGPGYPQEIHPASSAADIDALRTRIIGA